MGRKCGRRGTLETVDCKDVLPGQSVFFQCSLDRRSLGVVGRDHAERILVLVVYPHQLDDDCDLFYILLPRWFNGEFLE